IAEGLHPAVLVAVEDLVAGLARNPELGAQRRHLLALEQAGDKPESLVHDVTLLPRHAPSWWGQSVTHPLGIRCYLTLRKDKSEMPRAFRDLTRGTARGARALTAVTRTSNLSGRQRVGNPAHWCGPVWWGRRGHAGAATPGDAGSRNQEVLSALHFVHRGGAGEIAAESRRPELSARLTVPGADVIVAPGAEDQTRGGDNDAVAHLRHACSANAAAGERRIVAEADAPFDRRFVEIVF